MARAGAAGIGKALAAHAEPGKCSVHFRADASGLLALERAEAVFETIEEYTVQVAPASGPAPAAATPTGHQYSSGMQPHSRQNRAARITR